MEIRECGAGRLVLSLVSCRSIPWFMCYFVTTMGELLLLKRENFAHARNWTVLRFLDHEKVSNSRLDCPLEVTPK